MKINAMNYKKRNLIVILILLLLVTARALVSLNADNDNSFEKYSGKTVKVEGYISDEPLTKDFSKTFTLKAEKIDGEIVDTYIRVETNRHEEYEYGQSLILNGKLSKPFNFKSNGGRTFDYINFLLKDGIVFIMKKPEIVVVDGGGGGFITKNLFKIKQKFLGNIKNVLGEPHAALAGGLVVGEKSALGKDLINEFRVAGLIHVVVLSGYNITIVADSIRRMLSFLPRTAGIIIGGAGIVAFGILVGGGATVVRSCIMATIGLVGSLARRDYNVKIALFISAVIMLLQNPRILLFDPSFQLSFLATIGLIAISPIVEKRLGFITEKFGIRGLISSTLATQIFVSPYILYMMGQLSIIGVIVNILVLPIIPLTMLFVFLTGALGFFSHIVSEFTGWISHILLSYELSVVHFFSNIPFASIELPKFSFWIVIGFYAVYFVLLVKLPETLSQFTFRKKSST